MESGGEDRVRSDRITQLIQESPTLTDSRLVGIESSVTWLRGGIYSGGSVCFHGRTTFGPLR